MNKYDYAREIELYFTAIPTIKYKTICDKIVRTRKNKGNIYVCGNGGSMAIAEHFVTDLQKINYPAISLSNPSLLTMVSNDKSFANSFLHSLKNIIRLNDFVILFSCSGKSRNILKSIYFLKKNYIDYMVISGFGNTILNDYDKSITVVTLDGEYEQTEDIFQMIAHYIILLLKGE